MKAQLEENRIFNFEIQKYHQNGPKLNGVKYIIYLK